MDIFDVLTLLCGLALFLYGMEVMGDSLKKSAGRNLKTILANLTSNKLKGFLLGLGVTAIIQSSSATTVMVVGFVNSGTMTLSQAIGVIMGANVGTAVTSWITALNGIEGGTDATVWLNYLKPDAWMPILAFIGICFILFGKKAKHKDIGGILMGFAVLMVGMDTMSAAVEGLKESESFHQILTIFSNPILGILAGTVLTAIIQSSSASVGILQALSKTGAISYGSAMPIIMGQNIGTCITAMISSVSANKNGKRAAFVHLYFNIIGVFLWMCCYYLIDWILNMTGAFDLAGYANSHTIDMWGIAAIHTIFKIFSVITLFPFTGFLEKLAYATVKGDDKKGDNYTELLDERLLDTPDVALERSYNVASQMAHLACDSFCQALYQFNSYSPSSSELIRESEDKVDVYEDVLGSYLVQLSSRNMSEADSLEVTKLLYMLGEFERISDHAVNLVESVEEIKEKNTPFSEEATKQLNVLFGALEEIVKMAESAFVNKDLEKAHKIEPLEEVVDHLRDKIRLSHILRIQKVECTIEQGFILSDILTNLERVSDHCSNVAGGLIEIAEHSALNIHNYQHRLKSQEEDFTDLYNYYSEKYSISDLANQDKA